jgi:branched-chain amino acid transport system substrate-binding protein
MRETCFHAKIINKRGTFMMTQRWRILSRGICLLALILFLFSTVSLSRVWAAEPIKIGVILSITGWGGFLGAPMKDAVIAITEDVNRKGGLLGRQVELLIEDDKSNPSTAVIATTKLIRDKKVAAIVGPTIVDSGMAMIPTCEQEQTPFVVTGPLPNLGKKWVFIIGPGDIRGAARLLELVVNELGMKRIALLHDSTNYGKVGAQIYNKEITRYPNASLIIQERYDNSDTSMVPQLSKIKALNPDIMILHGTGGLAAVIAKNYKQLGMKIPVITSHATAVPDFVKLAGPIAEESGWIMFGLKSNIVDTLPADDPYRKNLYEPFKKLMKDKFGDSVKLNLFHATAYDGLVAAMEAIKAAGTDDRAEIRNALEKIKLELFLGPYECTPEDHQGSKRDYHTVPMLIKNGNFVPFKK